MREGKSGSEAEHRPPHRVSNRPGGARPRDGEPTPRFFDYLHIWVSHSDFQSLISAYSDFDPDGRFAPAWFTSDEPQIVTQLGHLTLIPGYSDAVLWNRSRSLPLVHAPTESGDQRYLQSPDGIKLRHWTALPGVIHAWLLAPGLVAWRGPGDQFRSPSEHTWRVWAMLSSEVKRLTKRLPGRRDRLSVSSAAREVVLATPAERTDMWRGIQALLRQRSQEGSTRRRGLKTPRGREPRS